MTDLAKLPRSIRLRNLERRRSVRKDEPEHREQDERKPKADIAAVLSLLVVGLLVFAPWINSLGSLLGRLGCPIDLSVIRISRAAHLLCGRPPINGMAVCLAQCRFSVSIRSGWHLGMLDALHRLLGGGILHIPDVVATPKGFGMANHGGHLALPWIYSAIDCSNLFHALCKLFPPPSFALL